jgi:ribosome-interacting GTPase 1
VDDLIDVIEGNRRYVKCLYVYNKVTAALACRSSKHVLFH